jgi:hypothetical protein
MRVERTTDIPPEDLEALSTRELHDRAVHRAEKHLDVRFFWRLLEMIPAAESASGDVGEAEFDSQVARGQISDALHSGEGELGEAMRPVFIEYLRRHPGA